MANHTKHINAFFEHNTGCSGVQAGVAWRYHVYIMGHNTTFYKTYTFCALPKESSYVILNIIEIVTCSFPKHCVWVFFLMNKMLSAWKKFGFSNFVLGLQSFKELVLYVWQFYGKSYVCRSNTSQTASKNLRTYLFINLHFLRDNFSFLPRLVMLIDALQ